MRVETYRFDTIYNRLLFFNPQNGPDSFSASSTVFTMWM